jgi:hypothetical protein
VFEEEDKVEFFIKEKSSSVEPDNDMTSSGIDPMAARPNPWFEKFLKKGSSMIEDQIFGAVKKYEDIDEKGSEDAGMVKLCNAQADTEKNIADLLEDDEDLMEPTPPPAPQIIESQPPSSNLSQLLKGESSKKAHVDDSSDDDFMFRPVPQQQKKNKKQKKQKGQVLSLEEFHRAASQPRETDSGSVADSESEKVSDQEGLCTNQGASKDGWSFEVDEEDVNKLLENRSEHEIVVARVVHVGLLAGLTLEQLGEIGARRLAFNDLRSRRGSRLHQIFVVFKKVGNVLLCVRLGVAKFYHTGVLGTFLVNVLVLLHCPKDLVFNHGGALLQELLEPWVWTSRHGVDSAGGHVIVGLD